MKAILLTAGLAALTFALIGLSGCSVVGPGERGVRTVLGAVSDEPLQPGPHLWVPFLFGTDTLDVQIKKSEVDETAASKDMQDVHAKIAVNWSLAPENVIKTYRQIGDERAVERVILVPAVNEVMKAATSKRTAEEVLSKRMEMKADIDKALTDRLAQYGIKIYDVSIVNLSFSEQFSQAIEHKQVAEQQAQQAAFVAAKATQDAKAEIEKAKGQATAQGLVRATITPELLQKLAIEKWDGHFPQMMGAQALPFINMKAAQ